MTKEHLDTDKAKGSVDNETEKVTDKADEQFPPRNSQRRQRGRSTATNQPNSEQDTVNQEDHDEQHPTTDNNDSDVERQHDEHDTDRDAQQDSNNEPDSQDESSNNKKKGPLLQVAAAVGEVHTLPKTS